MHIKAMMATLKSLKLYGMAGSIADLAEQSSPAYQKALPVLESLLKAEVAERDTRSIKYQMNVAKFPAYQDLAPGKPIWLQLLVCRLYSTTVIGCVSCLPSS